MIFLGIGSNLSSSFGNRFYNIDRSIFYLENQGIKLLKKSSFYETPSYPDIKQPKFINVVVAVNTKLMPAELMSVLIFTEEKLERKRSKKNDPRTCDIDLIDYNNQQFNLKYKDYNLTIPHKNMTKRNFVLYPLKEISPNWTHPKTKENINNLINKLTNDEKKSILKVVKN
tara:strand:- start:113 stop:625 length:513 start_codon:yes stop_codon:yes gene_type:complete